MINDIFTNLETFGFPAPQQLRSQPLGGEDLPLTWEGAEGQAWVGRGNCFRDLAPDAESAVDEDFPLYRPEMEAA